MVKEPVATVRVHPIRPFVTVDGAPIFGIVHRWDMDPKQLEFDFMTLTRGMWIYLGVQS